MFPTSNMTDSCSQLHCQKGFNSGLFSCKIWFGVGRSEEVQRDERGNVVFAKFTYVCLPLPFSSVSALPFPPSSHWPHLASLPPSPPLSLARSLSLPTRGMPSPPLEWASASARTIVSLAGLPSHPRSDARQSRKSIPRIFGGIDAKSGFKLPERWCIGVIYFCNCHA